MSQQTKLTDVQQEQIAQHLRKRAPQLHCPVCGHKNFIVIDVITMGNTFTPSDQGVHLGSGVPMAMAACENCFHVLHFAAIPLGVVPGDKSGG